MRVGHGLTLALLFLAPPVVAAEDLRWHCRNGDLEIVCGGEGCRANAGHTPMELDYRVGGRLSLCAYSGCVEGQPAVHLEEGPFLMLAGELENPRDRGETETVSVTFDRKTRVANLFAFGFSQPMSCEVD